MRFSAGGDGRLHGPRIIEAKGKRVLRVPRAAMFIGVACLDVPRLGPVHANNGLALATRRAERKDCDEANTQRIREEH
ncbi:hypothetical protein, partial [Burkholderia sp. BCCCDS09]|uniref:hypothetical protein n=1 Tax=Burkholderia sp. BCCCDS09 TaxID=3390236 RepID=UPI003D2ECDF8